MRYSEQGELERYVLTGGEVNDVTRAIELVTKCEGKGVVGDRAYDNDASVIPSRSNRMVVRSYERFGALGSFVAALSEWRA